MKAGLNFGAPLALRKPGGITLPRFGEEPNKTLGGGAYGISLDEFRANLAMSPDEMAVKILARKRAASERYLGRHVYFVADGKEMTGLEILHMLQGAEKKAGKLKGRKGFLASELVAPEHVKSLEAAMKDLKELGFVYIFYENDRCKIDRAGYEELKQRARTGWIRE